MGPALALATAKSGKVWIGFDTGVYRVAVEDGMRLDKRIGLPSGIPSALHVDPHDTLWVGTGRGDFGYVENDAFVSLRMENGPEDINALATDAKGTLWLSTLSRGVMRFDRGSLTTISELHGNKSLCVIADRRGRVWMGFSDGTAALHEDGAIRVYSRQDGLVGGSVNVIFEDTGGRIWAGTNDGLSRFNNGRFAPMATRAHLPIGPILAIVQDEAGFLWLGAASGIARVSIDDLEHVADSRATVLPYVLYDAFDGLPGVPAVYGSSRATLGGDRRLWFSAGRGIGVLEPSLVRRREPPGILIERLSADNRAVAHGDPVVPPPLTAHVQLDTGPHTDGPHPGAVSLSSRWVRSRLDSCRYTALCVLYEPSAAYVSVHGQCWDRWRVEPRKFTARVFDPAGDLSNLVVQGGRDHRPDSEPGCGVATTCTTHP